MKKTIFLLLAALLSAPAVAQTVPTIDQLVALHRAASPVISPDGSRVAYTLAATARPSVEIRLSDSGKDNPEELRRIKKAISELPRVELLAVADPKKVVVGLPGELVDWLDGKRILIVQAGELVVLDVDSGTKVLTKIKAPSALQVFVR